MHNVYILLSQKDNDLYIGYTTDVERRLREHNIGKAPSTKNKRPLELIYCESYKNKKDAMERERYLKTGWGKKYIRKILENTLKKN